MASFQRTLILLIAAFATLGLLTGGGCDDTGKAGAGVAPVKVKGKTYFLEIADTDAVRTIGLGQRDHIDADGGMIFVFPGTPRVLDFLMRDCPIPIDVIFTDREGKVLSWHAMVAEAPRGPDEGKAGDLVMPYEMRLKKYSSRFPAVFAIELKGGTVEQAGGLKEGDKVEFDAAGLRAKAR